MKIKSLSMKTILQILLLSSILSEVTILHAQNPNLDWGFAVGNSNEQNGYDIAQDSQGNVYSTGTFAGTVDFDPSISVSNITSNGDQDVYLRKIDNLGNLVWIKSFGGPLLDFVDRIYIEPNGNILLFGWIRGTVDMDPGPGIFNISSLGQGDSYVLRLDQNGNFVNCIKFGNTGDDLIGEIEYKSNGEILICGYYTATCDFDPSANTFNLVPSGSANGFLLHLNNNLSFINAYNFGSTGYDDIRDIAVDNNGNIYLTGIFQGTVDFDLLGSTSNVASNAGTEDGFIAKYSPTLGFIYAYSIGNTGTSDRGWKVECSNNNDVFISGMYTGTVDFNPSPTLTTNISSNGNWDVFLTKYNSSGVHQWTKSWGSLNQEYNTNMKITPQNNLIDILINYTGTMDLDPNVGTQTVTSNGGSDMSVIRLNDSGVLQNAFSFGSTANDNCYYLMNSECNLILSGNNSGVCDIDLTNTTNNITNNGLNDCFLIKYSFTNNTNAGTDQTICAGANIVLAGSGAATYSWNNGITNGVAFTPVVTNTYTLTGTSANGCVATDQVLVTVNPTPTVNAGADQTICAGANINLIGSGAATYSWNNGITNGVAFTPVSTNTYTLTGTSVKGCIATDQVIVTVNPLPIVNAGADQSICAGANSTLSGSGAATYSWNNGITNGVAFTPVSTNTYTLTGTSANGCVSTDQVVVTVNPLPTVNAGVDQSICSGSNITLVGSGAATYSWNNGITNGVSFSPIATNTYTLTGTSASGCVATDQVIVTVNPLPTVNAGADQLICSGANSILSGSGASTYSWNNGVTNGVPFTPASSNTYTVTGTDQYGCANTDQVTVTVNQTPSIDAGLDQSICEGTAVTLSGSGGTSYSWTNAITNGVSFVPVFTNTYTVTGTNQSGCSNTDQVTVIVNENGFITIDETAMDSYTLNGQTYTQSGTYTQVIPTVGGCDSTITLNLTLSYTGIDEISNGILMYPNPTSEVLHLEGIKGDELKYEVFDAAGRLVLNGVLKNQTILVIDLQPGTYTLKLENIAKPLRFVKE